jgi:hypothetical protein
MTFMKLWPRKVGPEVLRLVRLKGRAFMLKEGIAAIDVLLLRVAIRLFRRESVAVSWH